jgi:hypothetical protein
LIANGVTPHGLTWDQALGAAQVLVRTGRAIPADKWVERFQLERVIEQAEGNF